MAKHKVKFSGVVLIYLSKFVLETLDVFA